MTLNDLDATFTSWLGDGYDLDAIHLALITAALVKLDGDLLWTLIVSGSGNAKTETVQALRACDNVHIQSTLTSDAALLSGSPDREKGVISTGGLLVDIGAEGLLVLKDVTSILSMPHQSREPVLSALREIYDGSWTRSVGANGGKTLKWSGRLAVLGAVTTAWDSHHGVVSKFGDRFVLLRTDSNTRAKRRAASRQAVANLGSEKQMQDELAAAAKAVLDNVTKPDDVDPGDERLQLMADLACKARGSVERDSKGVPLYAHAQEMPTRFAKQLAQIVRGGVAIGMTRTDAMRLALRCALDSIPPMRLMLLRDLASAEKPSLVADVVKRVQQPRNTVDRELQCLQLLGLTKVDYEEYLNKFNDTRERWLYTLSSEAAEDFGALLQPDALRPEKQVEATHTVSGKTNGTTSLLSTTHSNDFSGQSGDSAHAEYEAYVTSVLAHEPPEYFVDPDTDLAGGSPPDHDGARVGEMVAVAPF